MAETERDRPMHYFPRRAAIDVLLAGVVMVEHPAHFFARRVDLLLRRRLVQCGGKRN
jgi:hypothetical protein